MAENYVDFDSMYLHQDAQGRLYFDRCETDTEHLLVPVVEGEERRHCRLYLDNKNLFGGMIGKKGRFKINIRFEPEQG